MVKKLALPLILAIFVVSITLIPVVGNRGIGADIPFHAPSVCAQGNRITVEGADSTLSYGLQESDELNQQAAGVSPRILVEYADSVFSIDLEPPMLVTNEPPIANAGADQTATAGATTTLDASGSRDTDGSIVSYEWDFGDGTMGSGKTVTHTYPEVGTYTAILSITDNSGAKATDTVTIQVTLENNPPIISNLSADEYEVDSGASVTIRSVVSDPEGDSITYNWTCDDGTIRGTGSIVTWIAPIREGSYSISLEVNDGRGGVQTGIVSIQVLSEPEATPTATSPTSWWRDPQWLVIVVIAGVACLVGIIRLIIRVTRGP